MQRIPKPPRDSPRLPSQDRRSRRDYTPRPTTIPMLAAMETYFNQQRSSPSLYPETWWQVQENVGARRQFDTGQRTGTYTPPSQAQIAAAPRRDFNNQQRIPAQTPQSINEAIRQRPANMPLSTSMTRDQLLRQAAELASMAEWRRQWDVGRTERSRQRQEGQQG